MYVNDVFKCILDRNDKKKKFKLGIPEEGLKLSILVENMGRINYGSRLLDKKGIISDVRLGQQCIYHWDAYTLPLDDVSEIQFQRNMKPGFNKHPLFLRGILNIEGDVKDTFISPDGFKKGLVWVNGRLLSRYWKKGPQHTLYLPAPWLKKGYNEIVVLEFEGFRKPILNFSDTPILDK